MDIPINLVVDEQVWEQMEGVARANSQTREQYVKTLMQKAVANAPIVCRPGKPRPGEKVQEPKPPEQPVLAQIP